MLASRSSCSTDVLNAEFVHVKRRSVSESLRWVVAVYHAPSESRHRRHMQAGGAKHRSAHMRARRAKTLHRFDMPHIASVFPASSAASTGALRVRSQRQAKTRDAQSATLARRLPGAGLKASSAAVVPSQSAPPTAPWLTVDSGSEQVRVDSKSAGGAASHQSLSCATTSRGWNVLKNRFEPVCGYYIHPGVGQLSDFVCGHVSQLDASCRRMHLRILSLVTCMSQSASRPLATLARNDVMMAHLLALSWRAAHELAQGYVCGGCVRKKPSVRAAAAAPGGLGPQRNRAQVLPGASRQPGPDSVDRRAQARAARSCASASPGACRPSRSQLQRRASGGAEQPPQRREPEGSAARAATIAAGGRATAEADARNRSDCHRSPPATPRSPTSSEGAPETPRRAYAACPPRGERGRRSGAPLPRA